MSQRWLLTMAVQEWCSLALATESAGDCEASLKPGAHYLTCQGCTRWFALFDCATEVAAAHSFVCHVRMGYGVGHGLCVGRKAGLITGEFDQQCRDCDPGGAVEEIGVGVVS